jgi:tetratricopeptide (TPR) repeat protein
MKMNMKKNSLAVTRQLRLFLIVFIFAFLFGTHFGFSQKRFMLDQNEALKFKLAKQLYQKGQQLFLKGKFKKAEEALKDCLEKFPKYSDADYYMSQICYKKEDFPQALQHIKKAKKNYKFMADLGVSTQLEYMDSLRKQKQDLEEDLRNMKQQLADGNFKGGAFSSVRTELQGKIASAEKSLIQIEERLKNPIPTEAQMSADYYYVHGNILFKLKKYKESLDQYLQAVRVNPNHGNAYNNIANLNFMARQYQRALYYLEKAEICGIKVNPKFREAIYKAMGK